MEQPQRNSTIEADDGKILAGVPEIEIPPTNPFANDLLGNRRRAESLAEIIERAHTLATISLDADWGNGKTTFLNMLCQLLRNKGFEVVTFNAWETDFTESPFATLAAEIVRQAKQHGSDTIRDKALRVAKAAIPIAAKMAPGVATAAGTMNPLPALHPVLIAAAKIIRLIKTPDLEKEYTNTQEGIRKFKDELKDLAALTAHEHNNKPLIIAIDELDRCRPDYAIRFLETVKHIFNTPGVMFVITTNIRQMAHTVRAVYGQGFDAEEYLDRFFDLNHRITHTDRSEFIARWIKDIQSKWTGIREFAPEEHDEIMSYQSKSHQDLRRDIGITTEILTAYIDKTQISLRRTIRLANRINLILELIRDRPTTAIAVVTLVSVIRDHDASAYANIIDGSADDQEIYNSIFKAIGDTHNQADLRALIEGTAIGVAHVLPANEDQMQKNQPMPPQQYPLTAHYRSTKESDQSDLPSKEYATKILIQVENVLQLQSQSSLPISEAIRAVELIVAGDRENPATANEPSITIPPSTSK